MWSVNSQTTDAHGHLTRHPRGPLGVPLLARFDASREQAHLADMPKRKEPELDPKEQHKRFKEAAKKAGVTDSEEQFERVFEKIAQPKKASKRPLASK